MTTLLTVIDNSVAARPVLVAADALAALLGATVEALHVSEDGDRTARGAAGMARVPYRCTFGDPVERILAAAHAKGVVAIAIGARDRPGGRRPVGSTAVELITRLDKPVLVVPPDREPPEKLRHVLVALDGTSSTADALRSFIELATEANLDVVLTHVCDEEATPWFSDQPQYETDVWATEFLARYCSVAAERVRLELRVGVAADQVLAASAETQADLVVLGWAQVLGGGRAPVVREALVHSAVPVLLLPTSRTTAVVGASA